MNRTCLPLLFAVAAATLLPHSALAFDTRQSPPPRRIVEAVDDNVRVALRGAVHPLANHHNDRGLAPDDLQMDRMQLIFRQSRAQQAELKQLIRDLHTPGRPDYHHWLTPEEFGERFGPSDQDVEIVTQWLSAHGFAVTRILPGKQIIEFSGNVKQLSETFHVSMHRYVVNGSTHYASATDPEIPAALSPVIKGFVSLNNFHPKRLSRILGRSTYGQISNRFTSQWTSTSSDGSTNYIISPADFAIQYDLSPVYDSGTRGDGQTVAVINDSNINVVLVNKFQEMFGLPHNPPHVIIDGDDPGIDGINNPDGPNYDSLEAYLDVEWAGAIAPGATIDLVIAGDTSGTPGVFLAAERAVADNLASIISVSFGSCEKSLASSNALFASLWSEAAAQGITVVVSTGDSGAAGCDLGEEFAVGGNGVNGIASTPYNIAVGGTDFYYSSWDEGASAISSQLSAYWDQSSTNSPNASMRVPITEQPWNDSQFGLNLIDYFVDVAASDGTSISSGGGGASSCINATYDSYGGVVSCVSGYEKPLWQAGTDVPDDHVRDIPDLSIFAGDGANYSFYPICASDGDCEPSPDGTPTQVTGAGGTSFSAPAFAAVMALVNERYGRQGQADFVLYPLEQQFPNTFHDITVGDNTVPCLYSDSLGDSASPNCIAASDPITLNFGSLSVTEGKLGVGSTPDYGAAPGYDLATGLGTLDVNALLSVWNKIVFVNTEMTLTPSATSLSHGTPIAVWGSVTAASGAPTGQVSILTDSSNASGSSISSARLDSQGNFSTIVDNLPGGTYNVWGEYSGDGTSGPSTSTQTLISVTPENSSIIYDAYYGGPSLDTGAPLAGQTIAYGQQIYLRAAVLPTSYYSTCIDTLNPSTSCNSMEVTPATGTVTFSDNGGVIDTSVLNSRGLAEVNPQNLSPGPHSIYASYSGDSSYNASIAPPTAFTVARYASQIISSVNYLVASAGQEVVLTVRVAGSGNITDMQSEPTGTVTLEGAPSGVPMSGIVAPSQVGGVAMFIFPADTPAGTYDLAIKYSGDANYDGALSNQTVRIGTSSKMPSTTIVTSTSTVTSPTAAIGLIIAVTGQPGKGAPTGMVDISSSGCDLGTVSLTPGGDVTSEWSGIFNSKQVVGGENLITVQYEGDGTYAPSATTLELSNPLSDFSLVPNRTVVPLAANSSGTVIVYLSSFNGFGGQIDLTCVAPSGITCAPSSSTATLLSDGTDIIPLDIEASSAAAIGNNNLLVTATSGVLTHTLGLTALVRNNVPDGLMMANSGNITLDRGAAVGNTVGITVSPVGKYSGEVVLSCQVSGMSAGTNSPQCQVGSPVTLGGGQSASTTLSIESTVETSVGVYSVTVIGQDSVNGAISGSTVVKVTIENSGFTLSNSGNIVIPSGTTTGNTSTISIAPTGGFNGTVQLSCSVTTNQAGSVNLPTCSVPSSVNITGTSPQTAILSVSTAKTTAIGFDVKRLLSSSSGMTLAIVILFVPFRRREKRTLKWGVMCVVSFVIATLGCAGCAEFTAKTSDVLTSTAGGTYTVNVIGTANNESSRTAVLLTVQ